MMDKLNFDFRPLSDRALFALAGVLADGGTMAKELGAFAAAEGLARYRGEPTSGCAELVIGGDMDPGMMVSAIQAEVTILERSAAISRDVAAREDCNAMAEFLFSVYEQILNLCRMEEAD